MKTFISITIQIQHSQLLIALHLVFIHI